MKAMETTLSSAGIAAKGNPVELPAWLESWEYEGKEASAPYEHAHEHDLDGVIANKKAASNAGAEKSGGTNPILPSAHGSGAFGTREAASEDRYVWVFEFQPRTKASFGEESAMEVFVWRVWGR